MQTDRYTKLVLTIIAVALTAIAIKLWAPVTQQPTLGELQSLTAIQDPSSRHNKTRELIERIPIAVVRVDGTVSTAVINQVDVRPSELSGLPGLPGLPR